MMRMGPRNASTAALIAITLMSVMIGAHAVDLRSSSCPTNIQQGDTGACVSELQTRLNAKGASVAVDGDFGPATLSAVKSFQSHSGLTVDGIVGPNTKAALYASSPGPAPSGTVLQKVVSAARSQIGVSYVWGGGHKATPGKSTGTCVGYTGSIQPCPAETTIGYDCSGLTRYAYYIATGRDILNGATGTQEASLKGHGTSSPIAGDVIFWDGHTAIYVSPSEMIQARQTGTNVMSSPLRSGGRYYHVPV